MKYLLVLTLIIQSLAMDMSELRERLSSLEDYTDKIDLRLNSLPGKDEDVIYEFINDNNIKEPFVLKYKYVNDLPAVYIFNPSKSTGFLWWKKYSFYTLNGKSWSKYQNKDKDLSPQDFTAITKLLE